MNNKLRSDITKIAQGNIQEVLKPMLDRIEALEDDLDVANKNFKVLAETLNAKSSASEIVQEPDMETETLEVENDLVIQNLEDSWKTNNEEAEVSTPDTPEERTEESAPETESQSNVEESALDSNLPANLVGDKE